MLTRMFVFPHPVNEVAARLVASMVFLFTVAILLANVPWLMFFLAFGFLARVSFGPRLSPFALIATRILIPLLGHPNKPVAGPPKRFAQTVGLVFSITALILHFGLGLVIEARIILAILGFFAFLESALSFCTGCFVFKYLMQWRLVPATICEKCNNFNLGK
jgi:uncharacterized membrane protein YesL